MKAKIPKEGWYVIGGLGIAALFRDPLNLLLQGVVEKAIESDFKFKLPGAILPEEKIIDMEPITPERPRAREPMKTREGLEAQERLPRIEPKTYFPILPPGPGLKEIQEIAPWLVMPGETMPRPRALEPKIPVMEDPITSKLLELAEMTRRAGGIAYGK